MSFRVFERLQELIGCLLRLDVRTVCIIGSASGSMYIPFVSGYLGA